MQPSIVLRDIQSNKFIEHALTTRDANMFVDICCLYISQKIGLAGATGDGLLGFTQRRHSARHVCWKAPWNLVDRVPV
jgi:hypothetical protein